MNAFVFGRLIGVALVFITQTVPAAFADQTAPELPALFDQLQDSTDPSLAIVYEQEIWQRWLTGPTDVAGDNLNAARAAMSLDKLDRADTLLAELTKSTPKFAEAWNQRALLRFLRKDYVGALRDIDETIRLEPRHFGALSGRGQCYLRLNQPQAALAAFEEALAIHPWLADVTRHAEILRTYLNDKNQGI
ncbi:MAG: tetratricopeptide repeat protein [Gammaproteobacteria bacterium]|nr:tetratricopeptide repeat protein [Gammaproteobacteria bacterium]